MTHSAARPLNDRERSVAASILRKVVALQGVGELTEQLAVAHVSGEAGMFLELYVPPSAPRSGCADGPLPVRSFVTENSGDPAGEIIIWIKQGVLSGLEYAWTSDEAPVEWPTPDAVSTTIRNDLR